MGPTGPNFPKHAFSDTEEQFFFFFANNFLWSFSADTAFSGLKDREWIPYTGTAHMLWDRQCACSCAASSLHLSEHGCTE